MKTPLFGGLTRSRRHIGPLLSLVLSIAASSAAAQDQCGNLRNDGQYGPYDYRTDRDKLDIVERNHFTYTVEVQLRGISGQAGGDIDYTLRAFPNHPRALVAMTRLAAKEKTSRPKGTNYTIDCYFDRALRFAPTDPAVKMVFSSFLAKAGKKAEAIKQLEAAEEFGANSANLHYNMGLAYVDIGDFEKALRHAHRAYQMGFNLPGLKAKLEKAGKWREPAPEKVAPEESAPAAGATENPLPAPAPPGGR